MAVLVTTILFLLALIAARWVDSRDKKVGLIFFYYLQSMNKTAVVWFDAILSNEYKWGGFYYFKFGINYV